MYVYAWRPMEKRNEERRRRRRGAMHAGMQGAKQGKGKRNSGKTTKEGRVVVRERCGVAWLYTDLGTEN